MMQDTIFFLAVVGLLTLATANSLPVDFETDAEGGIQFQSENWDAILERSAKEDKLIFLDVYATWCAPCKALKRNTFSQTEVGSYFNDQFINVAINGESAEGRKLAERYRVRAYPTLLFIGTRGRAIGSATGYHTPKQLIKLAKKYIDKR